MSKETEQQPTPDEQIDTIIGSLLDCAKLAPEGFPFFVNLEELRSKAKLDENRFYSFFFGVLSLEYDAIDFPDVTDKNTDQFEDAIEIRVKLNHENLHHYLRSTGRLEENERIESYKNELETRGRKTKIDWDLVHVHIAELIQQDSSGFFANQEATATEIMDWVKKHLNETISFSATKERLKPYWSRKDDFTNSDLHSAKK